MANITHGTITLTIPDALTPPDKAGKMTPDEVSRIPKPPRGIGAVCDKAADAIAKAGAKFTLPAGVTAAGLVESGAKAEDADTVLTDLEVVTQIMKQANLIFDADAYEDIRKVNDQVKVQAKHDPELLIIFKDVIEYFARGPRHPKGGGGGGAPGGGNG